MTVRPLSGWALIPLLVLAFLLESCSGSARTGGLDPASPAAPHDNPKSIPAPLSLPGRASSAAVATRLGADYEASMPSHSLMLSGHQALFAPDGNAAGLAGQAYAIYSLDLSTQTDALCLNLDWASAPAAGRVWLGLADWQRNAWHWQSLSDASICELADPAPYRNSDGSGLAVLLLGSGRPAALNWISAGLPEPPHIDWVSPLGGTAGQPVSISAGVSGLGPIDYAWDFASGATPALCVYPEPDLVLGEPGSYACTLSVSSPFGSDSFDFSLEVSAPDFWVHTLGAGADEQIIDLAADSQGNVYVALKSYETGSWLARYNPSGELLWQRLFPYDFNDVHLTVLADGSLCCVCADSTRYYYLRISKLGNFSAGSLLQIPDGIAVDTAAISPSGTALLVNKDRQMYRLDSDGCISWFKYLALPGLEDKNLIWIESVLALDDGRFWVCGESLDDSGLNSTFSNRVFCALLNADGSVAWARRGDVRNTYVCSTAALPGGVALLVARFAEQIPEDEQTFILTFDEAGNETLQLAFDGSPENGLAFGPGADLAFDGVNLHYTCRNYSDGLGSPRLVNYGVFTLGGELVDWRQLSGAPDTVSSSLAIGGDGSVYLGGAALNAGAVSFLAGQPSYSDLRICFAPLAMTSASAGMAHSTSVDYFSLTPASLVPDSGAGLRDGMLLRIEP